MSKIRTFQKWFQIRIYNLWVKIRKNDAHAYWYQSIINFGDLLTPELFRLYGVSLGYASPSETKILCVGSILQSIDDSYSGLVLGSGTILEDHSLSLPNANVLAVRGPRTLERLRSIKNRENVVLADPGLIACDLIKSSKRAQKKGRIGFVPHYEDLHEAAVIKLKKQKSIYYIDVQDRPQKVAQKISSCEIVLSSSLHGIIVAHSLGIPAVWVKPGDNLYGGEFKYYDYFESIHTTYSPQKLELDTDIDELVRNPIKVDTTIIEEKKSQLRSQFKVASDFILNKS